MQEYDCEDRPSSLEKCYLFFLSLHRLLILGDDTYRVENKDARKLECVVQALLASLEIARGHKQYVNLESKLTKILREPEFKSQKQAITALFSNGTINQGILELLCNEQISCFIAPIIVNLNNQGKLTSGHIDYFVKIAKALKNDSGDALSCFITECIERFNHTSIKDIIVHAAFDLARANEFSASVKGMIVHSVLDLASIADCKKILNKAKKVS